jgi:hypothetical protein
LTVTEFKGKGVATLLDEAFSGSDMDEQVAHLVLKPDWPIALCGANVSEFLGTGAPARDRCVDCLKIVGARGLGRPGWQARS